MAAGDRIGKLSITMSATTGALQKDFDQAARMANVAGQRIGRGLQMGGMAAGPQWFGGRGNALGLLGGGRGGGRGGGFGPGENPLDEPREFMRFGSLVAGKGTTGLLLKAGAAMGVLGTAALSFGVIVRSLFSGERATAALDRVQDSWHRLGVTLSDAVAPVVEDFSRMLTNIAHNLREAMGGLGGGGFDWARQFRESTGIGQILQGAQIVTEGWANIARQFGGRPQAARPQQGFEPGSPADRFLQLFNRGIDRMNFAAAQMQIQREAWDRMIEARQAEQRERRDFGAQLRQIREFADPLRNAGEIFRDRIGEIRDVWGRGHAPGQAVPRAMAAAVDQLEQALGTNLPDRLAPALFEGSAETASVLNRWRRDMARATETPEARAARILDAMQQQDARHLRATEEGVRTMQEILRRQANLRPANLR